MRSSYRECYPTILIPIRNDVRDLTAIAHISVSQFWSLVWQSHKPIFGKKPQANVRRPTLSDPKIHYVKHFERHHPKTGPSQWSDGNNRKKKTKASALRIVTQTNPMTSHAFITKTVKITRRFSKWSATALPIWQLRNTQRNNIHKTDYSKQQYIHENGILCAFAFV